MARGLNCYTLPQPCQVWLGLINIAQYRQAKAHLLSRMSSLSRPALQSTFTEKLLNWVQPLWVLRGCWRNRRPWVSGGAQSLVSEVKCTQETRRPYNKQWGGEVTLNNWTRLNLPTSARILDKSHRGVLIDSTRVLTISGWITPVTLPELSRINQCL